MEKTDELSLAKLVSKTKCVVKLFFLAFGVNFLLFINFYKSFPPTGHGPIYTAE
jgi:hypothetical protein